MAGGGPFPEPELEAARRLLGASPGADDRALRLAYIAAVKAAHPDRPGGDNLRLRQVIEAYGRLRAAVRRAAPPQADWLTISPLQAMRGGLASLDAGSGRGAGVRLPPGLRHGETFLVDGRPLRVSISGDAAAAVLGDHLCLTVEIDPAVLRRGGRLIVDTLVGPKTLWPTASDTIRGFARLPGQGLPERGARPAGDLFVRFKPAAAAGDEGAARGKLRRFAARWAA